MSFRLVTVATFNDPIAAALAKNYLESEDIDACLIDETTVATDWMIAGAIGGIKLQVSPMQLERAEMLLAMLREEQAEDEPVASTAIATQEVAEELQAEREDKEPINQLADKAFRSAVFGFLFVPLQFYTLYLLFLLREEPGKVSPNRRWKVWASLLLNIPLIAIIGLPLLWLISNFSLQPGTPDNPVWRRQLFNEHGFSVKLPHAPQYQQGMAIGVFGELHSQTWTAWSHHRFYRIVLDEYTRFPRHRTDGQILQAVANHRLLAGAGKMRQEAAIDFKGIPGREFWIDFGENQERGKCFLRGQDLITIYVLGARPDVESDEAAQFLQSFRIR